MKKAVFVCFYANDQINVDNVLFTLSVHCKNYDLVFSTQMNSNTGMGSEFDYYQYLNNRINAIDNLVNPDIFLLYFGCNSIEDAMGLMDSMGGYFKNIKLVKTIITPENISVSDTSLVEYKQYKYIFHIVVTPIKIVMTIEPVSNTINRKQYDIIAVGYR